MVFLNVKEDSYYIKISNSLKLLNWVKYIMQYDLHNS